jgi:hypothetical protein
MYHKSHVKIGYQIGLTLVGIFAGWRSIFMYVCVYMHKV